MASAGETVLKLVQRSFWLNDSISKQISMNHIQIKFSYLRLKLSRPSVAEQHKSLLFAATR